MSEPEKEQTWDFSIFMQVPAKALTAATTTPPPAHCTHKKESCEAGFSACGGSRKRHSSIPLQCDPRGAFLSYGNEVSYTIKKTGLRAKALQNLSFYTQAHVTRNTHIYLL